MTGSQSFLELLESVRKTTLDAFENQDLPFEKIVELVQPERDLSRNPVFQVMFTFLVPEDTALKTTHIELSDEIESSEVDGSQVDLSIYIKDDNEQMSIGLAYNNDLFESKTVQQMLEHYCRLLVQSISSPATRIDQIEMLSEAEKDLLLHQLNQTQRDYDLSTTLPKLFESQVDKTPDSTALIFENDSLTYKQLDCRANQLAHCLRENNVVAGDTVAVFMNRSLEMVIALYGIHKAGAAYVPLDSEYPLERLGWMLSDTQTRLILSQTCLQQKLPDNSAKIICIDDAGWSLNVTSFSESRIPLSGKSDDTAYVIYTSGSTGKPKGVLNSHSGIVNRLCWMQEAFPLTLDDRILHKTPYSFDVSVWEFFWPLINGATLVIARPEGHKAPAYLSRILYEQAITTVHFVPSMLRVFLESAEFNPAGALKRVICSGEALGFDIQQQFFQQSTAELHNLYGPTEAAVDVSHWSCKRDDKHKVVPIGYPIANTCLYILDAGAHLVPKGVAGELHIGGVQVSKGYLNRDELNAEKFISDPFSSKNNATVARLYKTGDRARYLKDGSIEYLGRIDNQVKLRGFRIELGEIESRLSEYQNIKAAVAVISEALPENPRLIAFVTGIGAAAFNEQELKDFLSDHLPEYMVPSSIQLLDQFPLSANGKVDRKTLATLFDLNENHQGKIVEPRNDVERRITEICRSILQVEKISVLDNFFALGGHSLLAIKVVSQLNIEFEIDMSFARFMELATIEKIAKLVQEVNGKENRSGVTSIRSRLTAKENVSIEGAVYPLSSAQERLWYISTLYPNVSAYNVQAHVVVKTDIKQLRSVLEQMQQQHAILRTTYTLSGSQPQQVVHQNIALQLTHFRLAETEGSPSLSQIEAHLHDEASRPFDLESGPIWRCTVVENLDGCLNLMITVHHIATDGWSMNLLKQQIQTQCSIHNRDIISITEISTIQYVDYVLWQKENAQTQRLELLRQYWNQTLTDIPSVIDLPTDKPRPPVYSYSGAIEYVVLSEILTLQLRDFSRDKEMTLFMVMLAAFKVLLCRYTQQSDIVVGTPVSGRTQAELDSVFGLFVNTLVLRSKLSNSLTFDQLLLQIRQSTLSAFEHHDFPFEQVVEMLQPERDLSRNPIFQVMFNFLVPDSDDEEHHKQPIGNLSDDIESSASAGSQLDLTLVVKNDGQRLVVGMVYNTDLFEKNTIRRMLDHYRLLLGSCMVSPGDEIYSLDMLDKKEKKVLLQQYNQTKRDYELNITLPELFERQVDKTPNNVAISFEGNQLTYRELDFKASQLAQFLQQSDVQVGDYIPVFMHRSLEMVIALYGILKVGAAYVPLDPEYPLQRLSWMLEDSSAKLILTQSSIESKLPVNSATVICIDANGWAENIKQYNQNRITLEVCPTDTAYVIYTSGSTGKPKGVMNAHNGVVNRLQWMQDTFPIGDDDNLLQKTPFSFDVSVWEFFWPLMTGASLVIARPDGHKDPAYLGKVIQQENISTIHFVPSMLSAFLSSGEIKNIDSLKRVFCSGEALTYDIQQEFFSQSSAELHNLYGPTEAAIDVTHWACNRESHLEIVPIGFPVANTRLYILDQHQQLLPHGIAGELHIGGIQVSKGYLNQEKLSAEKFITDVFSEIHNDRLYKTGDLARFLNDGSVEYLGRVDNQVKIRGFRIELGEIETLLSEHGLIENAVVIVREDVPGNQMIVAYVVPASGTADKNTIDNEKVISDYLKTKLPVYMLPSAIVWLDIFQLTSNGKIDYKLLPKPIRAKKSNIVKLEKPNNKLEVIMVKIWEELLEIDDIETDDMFFDLGGHSLMALKVVDRFAQETKIKIPPASLITQTLKQITSTAKSIQNKMD